MPMLLHAAALSVVIVPLAAPLAAQCPDGSAPPCGRVAVQAPPPNSVAVLYLDNLSRDTADAFLADGLTEEIIVRLAQVRRLEVKSRFESLRFRGHSTALDPPTLGRSLNVTYLVTGSVQRAGDRVRLRVALVRAATRDQVWGDAIERTSGDVLFIESDIATAVAAAIAGQLLPAERAQLSRPLTSDPVAYEEYLRGMHALNTSSDEASLRSALAHLDRATRRDSGFAAAFAGEAEGWAELADTYVSGLEAYGRARNAASRALALDSSQVLASSMLAMAVLALDFDAREAERIARRALSQDDRSSSIHVVLSLALRAMGRSDASIAEARRAWRADSLAWFDSLWYGLLLIESHQLDSAAAWLPRLRGVLPSSAADQLDGLLLVARGDLRGAESLINWRDGGGANAGTYFRILLARGDTIAARATVDSMLAARARGYYNPIALARAYAALGDIDHGIEWLRRGFEERTLWVADVRYDAELAVLRADPRYAALDRQLRY